MACYHPLKGIVLGANAETGKKNVKIVSSDFKSPEVDGIEYIQVPCGRCIGCRLKYSRDWAIRCMTELQYHDKACFITLTYDDEHIPVPNKIINPDGSITTSPVSPLVKRDLQLFFKRLRKKYPDSKIRYFACGEYGSASMRCHYHAILFGVDFTEDRVFYKKSFDNKFNYYTSPTLDSLWHNYDDFGHDLGQLGYAVVCDVSFDTCAYVARYVTKKKYGAESHFYDDLQIPPEFSVMSRKPGIGRLYFDENVDKIYKYDEIILSDTDGGKRFKPPRYYDKLFDIYDPVSSGELHSKRQEIAKQHTMMKSSYTSLSYLDMLKSEEENIIAKLEHKHVNRKKV